MSGQDQWWLAALGTTLIWARLREREAGTAEVLDCDGQVLVYDSPDSARSALLDAEFRMFDGLDQDDAEALGWRLADLHPPVGNADGSDAGLPARMRLSRKPA